MWFLQISDDKFVRNEIKTHKSFVFTMKLRRTKADKLFSDFIRLRDGYKCQRCHIQIQPPTKDIQCAHFHSRSKKSVRFEPNNALALCIKCHMYFDGNSSWRIDSHKKEFEEFMLKRLGNEAYDLLSFIANRPQKVDEEYICLWLVQEIEKLKNMRAPKTVLGAPTK